MPIGAGSVEVPADVLEVAEELRVRCGRELGYPAYRRCGLVVMYGSAVHGSISIGYGFAKVTESGRPSRVPRLGDGKPTVERPHIVGALDRPADSPAELQRFTVRCKCGAEHVVRNDRIAPVFVSKARAGELSKPGVVDIYTGEF